MPRSVSGTYTLPLPPVVPNTVILSAWANTTTEDIAQALTNSLDRGGSGGMVAPFRLVDGSETIPAFSFNAETGTGLWRNGDGVMAVSIQGEEVGHWSADGYTGAFTGSMEGDFTIAGDVTFEGVSLFEGAVAINGTFLINGDATFNGLLNVDTINCTDDAFFAGDSFFTGPVTFDITTFTDQATFQSLALFQAVVQPAPTSRMVPGGVFLQKDTYHGTAFTSTVYTSLPTATSTLASRGTVSPVPFDGFLKISGSILIQNNSTTAGVFGLRMVKNGSDFAPDFAYYCNSSAGGGALETGSFSLVFPVTAGDTFDIKGKVASGMNVDYFIYGPLFEMYSLP
jgi:hypothetical protein